MFAVVYVCCKWDTFRKLMVEFLRLGLPQEEYAFFFIDLFGYSLQSHPAKPWARGDADDNVAKKAFKVSLMYMHCKKIYKYFENNCTVKDTTFEGFMDLT